MKEHGTRAAEIGFAQREIAKIEHNMSRRARRYMHLYFDTEDRTQKISYFQRATEVIQTGTSAISELRDTIRKLRAEEKEHQGVSVHG